jgi:hypothetical protein
MIGRRATYEPLPGFVVAVTVVDVKVSYGRTRYRVMPSDGSGRTWVETLTFVPPADAPDPRD